MTRYNVGARTAARYGASRIAKYAFKKVGRSALRAVPFIGNAMAAYDTGRAIVNAGRKVYSRYSRGTSTNAPPRYTPRGVNTDSRPSGARASRAFGRASGRMGGRISPSKRVKGGFVAKAQQKGFSIHFEKGGRVSDTYCAYVGHGTCPQVILRRLMLGCIIKTLIRRLGMSFASTNQPLSFLTLGDQFIIKYRVNQETATETSITYTLAANQPTFQALLDAVVNAWVVQVQSLTFESSQDWKLTEALFSAAGSGDLTSVRIPLESASITFSASSSMKVQNRSVPSTDDDQADEVDRIPLKGKIYRFKGNGTNFKRSAVAALGEINFEPIGEKQDGVFTYSAGAAGGVDALKEPPLAYNFVRCQSTGSIGCDPGEIKTSVVRYSTTMTLATMLLLVVGTNESAANANISVLQTRGMFNLIALEKVMETSNTATTQLIDLAWEVDYKIFGFMSTRVIDNTIGEHYFGSTPA